VTDEPGTPKTALEKLRAKTLKTIILEDDIEVVIRGVGQDELMAAARMTPIADFESATEKELRKRIASAFTAKDGTFGIMVSEIVFRGVVEPKLFRGALKDCPDDALPLDALGPYRMHLLSEIMLMSGWEVDVVSAGKFRGGKGDVVDLPGDSGSGKNQPDESVPDARGFVRDGGGIDISGQGRESPADS
jgi:hypothetical protein